MRRKVKLLFTAARKILPDLDTRENVSWRAGKGHTWPLPLGVQAFFKFIERKNRKSNRSFIQSLTDLIPCSLLRGSLFYHRSEFPPLAALWKRKSRQNPSLPAAERFIRFIPVIHIPCRMK